MYYIKDISVHLGARTLLDHVSFMISPGDRTGLTGRNGAGKSTLLKIIAGILQPDEGSLEFPSKTTIGYLRQEFELHETRTVLDETMSCHKEALEIQQSITRVSDEIAGRTDYDTTEYKELVQRLADLSADAEHFNINLLRVDTLKILKGLGFTEDDIEKKVGELSGGWQMRIELAKLLLLKPDILLLDEPTNHLDIESIIWLENYLQDYPGTIILISHDIQFLDNVTNRTIEIENGRILDLKLKYSDFKTESAKQKEILRAAYENQQREIAQKERTINRFMAKATKTKMAQSMQKQLDKVERIELPEESSKSMVIRFAEVPRSGRDVIKCSGVSKSYNHKKVFAELDITIERGDRVAFVGQNGQGKTTMAKIITGLIRADSGQIETGSNVFMSYYAQNQSELLDSRKTILQVMEEKATEETHSRIRSILGSFLFSGEDVEKKVSVLSGGERARLAMASLITKPCNFLILDEPTNHLDIYSKEILKEALLDFGGTLLVISHDREFLKGLVNKVIEFRGGKTYEYLGDIEYFLNKRKLDNIREVEISNTDKGLTASGEKNTVQPISGKDQRKIRKAIQQVEREIEKIEKEIAEIELQLQNPDTYKDPGFNQLNAHYNMLKQSLEQKMADWEALLMETEA
ncbi:MAG: ABC-F family ATP-binding cassette domain-containing protein [Saprospiraceae bacterium]|nr:ABC-F family ATP-binding cassette domain-containing protein [Saprospiraceae bacterium]